MLDKIDINQHISNEKFREEIEDLRLKLNKTFQQTKALKIPVVIVYEGWGASGKGTLISKTLYPLDPRDFNVFTMDKVNEDIIMRPYLWSYWVKIPSNGRLAIFDKSYHRILNEQKLKLTEDDKTSFYKDVNDFEKQLTDDGCVIIKLFLHISKEEQKLRFDELLSKNSTKWRVDAADLEQNQNYDEHLKRFETMLQNTHVGFAPWHIVEANDTKYATIKTYDIIIAALEHAIQEKENNNEKQLKQTSQPVGVKILSGVDMNKSLSSKDYKAKLYKLQSELRDISFELYSVRRSVVIVYEGWDAAGKGGNIKRLTEEIDPRMYEVIPVAAPSVEELNHHYLWRFWKKMPKDGHLAIFDRSWYGRVMVERVEGYCSEEEYKRAYFEINEMEKHMSNHGTIVMKFWLNIDKDEQLKRFKDRESNPLKRYKMTDEDWRNREKWKPYEKAVDEMLFRTNTDYAPWHIIESNNKKYSRIKVLEIVVDTLNNKLNRKG